MMNIPQLLFWMNPTMNRKKFRALNVSKKKFPTQAFDIIDFRIFEKKWRLYMVFC